MVDAVGSGAAHVLDVPKSSHGHQEDSAIHRVVKSANIFNVQISVFQQDTDRKKVPPWLSHASQEAQGVSCTLESSHNYAHIPPKWRCNHPCWKAPSRYHSWLFREVQPKMEAHNAYGIHAGVRLNNDQHLISVAEVMFWFCMYVSIVTPSKERHGALVLKSLSI